MPIYEYKCEECGAQVEKMQKVADAPLTVCEVCGGKLEKQWSLSGIQFKGAGWYVHEYSNKMKDPNAAKVEKPADKSDKSDKTEKTSAVESTAKSETASNKASDTTATSSKKETPAKKD